MYRIKERPEDFIVTEILDLPQGDGPYHYYLLEKKNLSTETAVQDIARALNVERRHIGYAGNKDKNAITRQYLSIKGKHVNTYSREHWHIEHKGTGPRPISLGLNSGNHFDIIVRNVERAPSVTDEFINYFGEQRFSTHNVAIGLAILHKDYKQAVELLVQNNNTAVQKTIEAHPTDPVRALRSIPLKTLKLYIHAVQSWIWNETVSTLNTRKDHVPLIGYGTEFVDVDVEEHSERLLGQLNLTQRDFIIRALPELSSEGGDRQTHVSAVNVSQQYDESHKTLALHFDLAKGIYATEFIRQHLLHTHTAPVVDIT